jgi:hypothetical protein
MNNYGYSTCIGFQSNKQKCEESNIINNSLSRNDWGIFSNGASSTATSTINKCCLIKNKNKYLFYVYSGTMEVRECTIQSGYSIYGAVTTSYSNTVAGSECAAITNCGANISKEYTNYENQKTEGLSDTVLSIIILILLIVACILVVIITVFVIIFLRKKSKVYNKDDERSMDDINNEKKEE